MAIQTISKGGIMARIYSSWNSTQLIYLQNYATDWACVQKYLKRRIFMRFTLYCSKEEKCTTNNKKYSNSCWGVGGKYFWNNFLRVYKYSKFLQLMLREFLFNQKTEWRCTWLRKSIYTVSNQIKNLWIWFRVVLGTGFFFNYIGIEPLKNVLFWWFIFPHFWLRNPIRYNCFFLILRQFIFDFPAWESFGCGLQSRKLQQKIIESEPMPSRRI